MRICKKSGVFLLGGGTDFLALSLALSGRNFTHPKNDLFRRQKHSKKSRNYIKKSVVFYTFSDLWRILGEKAPFYGFSTKTTTFPP